MRSPGALLVVAMFLALGILAACGSTPQPAGPTAASTGLKPPKYDDLIVPSLYMTVAQLKRRDVVGPVGEPIGGIEAVLADDTGKVVAVVVEVGGFLGIGEKEVLVRLDQLRPDPRHLDSQLITTMTREEMEALPEWD